MALDIKEYDEACETKPNRLVAAIIMRETRFLVVYNIKYGLRIEPPGGKVNPGESPEKAVVREVFEELGMKVTPTALLGAYPTQTPEGAFDVHTYLCDSLSGEPQTDLEPEKIGHMEWLTLDELKALRNFCRSRTSHLLVPNLQIAIEDIERTIAGSDASVQR